MTRRERLAWATASLILHAACIPASVLALGQFPHDFQRPGFGLALASASYLAAGATSRAWVESIWLALILAWAATPLGLFGLLMAFTAGPPIACFICSFDDAGPLHLSRVVFGIAALVAYGTPGALVSMIGRLLAAWAHDSRVSPTRRVGASG